MFLWKILLVLSIVKIQCDSINYTVNQCPNIKTLLGSIRKRRYLAFPENTNLALTLSLVKTFMTHVPSGWFLVLEIDVLYPLPDAKFIATHSRKNLHHRQKRDFWERLQNGIDYHNLNGHACIIRSICEAKTLLAPPGRSLVHDILRAVFTAPLHNEEFMQEMGETYNELLDPKICEKDNDCPFSILNFILSMNKQR